ncbi:MAG: biotin-dependent carboxyltransferase family protein [Bacteroidota bacterium]
MIRDPTFAEILKTPPGVQVVDQGRKGWGQLGIPASAPSDVRAFLWVNHILRNPENAAVIEVSQPGLLLNFPSPTLICIAGAKAQVKLNGNPLAEISLLEIPESSHLEIGKFEQGAILYLGIRHGFQSELQLGSRSFFRGITSKTQFSKGDQIMYFTNHEVPQFHLQAKPNFSRAYQKQESIYAYPGPEWDLLSDAMKKELLSMKFQVTQIRNRMGIQLESPFTNELNSISTAPVYPGTVQLTPSGKLILLMQDAQVTGGYPRILQVCEEDLSILAQKSAGSFFRLKLQQF